MATFEEIGIVNGVNKLDINNNKEAKTHDADALAQLVLILAKLSADPATQTTLAAILAKIITSPATEAKQDLIKTILDDIAFNTNNISGDTSTYLPGIISQQTDGTQKTQITDNLGVVKDIALNGVPITGQALETGGTNILGWLSSIRKKIADLITAVGTPFQAGASIGNTAFIANAGTNLNTSDLALEATQLTTNTEIGGLTETSPVTDTASSGLNGRLQRIAQRISSFITATTDGTQKTQIVNGSGTVLDSSNIAKETGGNLANVSTNLGAQADASASTDTGTFSLISLFKRLLAKFVSGTVIGDVNINSLPQANLSAFGDLITAENTPLIQIDFVTGINTQIVSTSATNSSTINVNAARLRMQSGTNTAGNAIVRSLKTARYRAGQGMTARFTYVWTNNAANNTHIIGVGNTNDGYFFGYNGTTFGILHRNATVDTWIPQASWNNDKCDGTGTSAFTWNKTLGNVMQIRYPFLGYGAITFWVLHSTGFWIKCHTIQYPNSYTSLQLSNPNLSAYIQNVNSGNTTNIIGYCGSFSVLLSGMRKFLGPKGGLNNNKAVTSGTLTNLLTIKNATTYNGAANTAIIRLSTITAAFGNLPNNAFGYVKLIKNATLGGTPAFTAYSGTTADNGVTITNGQSVVSYDTAGTTVTGTIIEWNTTGVLANTTGLNVIDSELFLEPGATYTFAADVTANASVGVATNWVEDL